MTFEPDVCDDLRNRSHTPLLIDGLFLSILREYFSNTDNIRLTSLKSRIWNSDPQQTKIHIEPVYKWTPHLVDEYPALLVRRGPLRQITPSLYAGAIEQTQGKQVIIHKLWSGSHSILAISTIPYETEQLAFEVASMFSDYKRQILQYLALSTFDLAAVSELTLVDNTAAPTYAAEIQLQYLFSDTKQIDMVKLP